MAAPAAGTADEAVKKRFATVDDEAFAKILYEKDAKNTRRATESAVRTFKSYLREKNLPETFESIPNNELDKILSKFYTEVRNENGELYKKATLISLRHGINRHLGNSSDVKNIIHDNDFRESNKVFAAATKELKRQGKGGVVHYPPIEKEDLQKLYAYFDSDNNVKLQEKVFVDLMLYFGRRGRENIHELKLSDFAATPDSNGKVYVYLTKDELTKNHQEDENTASGRMYSRDDELCPVKSFMKYLKHLRGNKCDRFFQRPSTKANSIKWYDSQPMGHNTIGNFMPKISEKASLSVRYTNHSLRATSVHILDNVGNFAGRHIMTVTGHKSENSLKTYTGYTGETIKRKMSDTLSNSLRIEQCKKTKNVCATVSSAENDTNLQLQPLTNSEFTDLLEDLNNDHDFNDILSTMPVDVLKDNKESVPENKSVKNIDCRYNGTWNYTAPQRPQIQFPVFNNCSNITVNYNMK